MPSPKSLHTVAIIGGGATMLSFLVQFINKIKKHKIRQIKEILIFNNSTHFGCGLAYEPKTPPSCRLNMRTSTMSLWAEHDDEFKQYLTKKNIKFKTNQELEFPPRNIFGEFLRHKMTDVIKDAQDHLAIEIKTLPESVNFVNRVSKSMWQIKSENNKSYLAEYLVFALGNLPSQNYSNLLLNKNYIHEPYKEICTQKLADKKSITVLGTSLTAIDCALLLTETYKYKGKIYLVSRHGLLPKVQAEIPQTTELNYLEDLINKAKKSKRLTLDDFKLALSYDIGIPLASDWKEYLPKLPAEQELEKDIFLAERNLTAQWQSTLSKASLKMPYIWQALETESKKAFLRDFYSLWCIYRHGMPLINAKKILSLIKSKRLKILPNLLSVNTNKNSFTISFKSDKKWPQNKEKIQTDIVINATGTGHYISRSNNKLMLQLLNNGILQEHELGGVVVDTQSCQIIDKQNKKVKSAYFIGPLLRGAFFNTNALEMNALQAELAVNSIIKKLI